MARSGGRAAVVGYQVRLRVAGGTERLCERVKSKSEGMLLGHAAAADALALIA